MFFRICPKYSDRFKIRRLQPPTASLRGCKHKHKHNLLEPKAKLSPLSSLTWQCNSSFQSGKNDVPWFYRLLFTLWNTKLIVYYLGPMVYWPIVLSLRPLGSRPLTKVCVVCLSHVHKKQVLLTHGAGTPIYYNQTNRWFQQLLIFQCIAIIYFSSVIVFW